MCSPASTDAGGDLFAEEETVSSLQCCLCVFLSPPQQEVLVIILIRMGYLPLRRLQGSTWYRFCLRVEIRECFRGSVRPCSSLPFTGEGEAGQACRPASASPKTHFALPSASTDIPSFMSRTLRPGTGRGQPIRLNCRALCGTGVWDCVA